MPILSEDRKTDFIKWEAVATIEKWDDTADYEAGLPPDDVVVDEGNVLTTVGLNRLTNLVIGAGATAYNNTNSRIGVGNGAGSPEAAGDVDLDASPGSSNRQFKTMAATYPLQADGVITWRSVFGSSEANFSWTEWCVDHGTADGTAVTSPGPLNHKYASLGTKVSGATWTFTVTLTIS